MILQMKHFRGEMVGCLPSMGNQKTFTQTNYIFGLINSHYKTEGIQTKKILYK